MARLENKVALISGGGSGIGAATAKRFAEEGARVVICGRRLEPLQQVVDEIVAAGGHACCFSCDVSDESAVNDLIASTVDRYGKLDILINNATLIAAGMIAEQDSQSWRQNFSVTVDGSWFMMRAAYAQLKANRGAVVNIASVLAQFGTPAMTGYATAKAGIIGMTRNAAVEWAGDQIRCNVVVPGAFLTPPTLQVMPTDEAQQASAALIPLKRVGDPVECANAILFLASDEASYITGTTLNVDGGRAAELYIGQVDWE